MRRKDLIARLNFFYSLELTQVDLYRAQSRQMEDMYFSRTLAHFAETEKQHVAKIAAEIRKRGAEPIRIGEVIAPVLGRIGGTLTGALGPRIVFKAGIILEERAKQDYQDFIAQAGDGHLFDILWNNFLDEDLHSSWFANKLRELEQRS